MRFSFVAALGLSLGTAAITGCGGVSAPPSVATTEEESRAERQLIDIGELFRQYTFDKKKPPTAVSDFAYLDAVAPVGLMALRAGDVIARSGVVIQDTMEGPATTDPADEVLAYGKDVPASGGPVLMHNRKIVRMTADEFKAAKMAGTGEMAAGAAKKGS
ncbi:hypothetical protein [Paludisphaera rhizosphaerae]|uniref:hypothetical protein n=1 Tax=Paludisphaera rhizosphaerae TaxID=2711216 RepID=UPI0013EC20E0|nr:hypothetical protein [Paludisphaera rhizosphaerae]